MGDGYGCDLQHDPLALAWVLDVAGYGHARTVAGARGGVSVRADLCVAEVAVHAGAGFLACGDIHAWKGKIMISDFHWNRLEIANR